MRPIIHVYTFAYSGGFCPSTHHHPASSIPPTNLVTVAINYTTCETYFEVGHWHNYNAHYHGNFLARWQPHRQLHKLKSPQAAPTD